MALETVSAPLPPRPASSVAGALRALPGSRRRSGGSCGSRAGGRHLRKPLAIIFVCAWAAAAVVAIIGRRCSTGSPSDNTLLPERPQGAGAGATAFVKGAGVLWQPLAGATRHLGSGRAASQIEIPKDLKKYLKILIDGVPHQILTYDPRNVGGKGSWIVRCEMLNMFSGLTVDITLKGGEVYEPIQTDWTDAIYTYFNDATGMYIFMDGQTYEEVELSNAVLGDIVPWLEEGTAVEVERYENRAITVRLKEDIESEIASIREFTGGYTHIRQKSGVLVTLTNGIEMRTLKQYIKKGDKVLIDREKFEIKSRL